MGLRRLRTSAPHLGVMSSILIEPIKGNERLWKVFWIYHLAIGLPLTFAIEPFYQAFGFPASYVYLGVYLVWALWVTIGLWQCAYNTNLKGMGLVIRLVVIWGLGSIVFTIINS